MRKLIDLLIEFYLMPLWFSNRLAIYVKGRILRYNEHYTATIDVIRRKFSTSSGVIIDIGAFNADSVVYFARFLPHHRIMAFEPNPIPFAKGVVNSRPYKNIESYNLGFSDIAGEVDFYLTNDFASSSLFDPELNSELKLRSKIKVKVETLDSFFKTIDKVILIKLDVQGAELNILKQGKLTLKKTKLVLTEMLISKIYKGGCNYYEVDEFLRENGFVIHSIFSSYNNEGTKYFDVLYINQDLSL